MKWVVRLHNGSMTVIEADSKEHAHWEATGMVGRDDIRSIEQATEEDIAWFRAMSGGRL